MKKRLLSALAVVVFLICSTAWAATTHYNFVLPTVGASQNTWGSLLNTIFNLIDTDLWTVSGGRTIAVNAPVTSASNITLTNPLSSTQNISFSNTSLKLILPAMNVSQSMVPGGILAVSNVGSNAFSIVAQDTTTAIISSLPPGFTIYLTLLSGATANGTFQYTTTVTSPSSTVLPVSAGGTGNSSLTAHGVVVGNGTSAASVTGAGTAAQVLTSNGASADPTFQTVAFVPTGASIIWNTTSCPSGYTYENGQAISRAGQAALFGVIGTTFGSGDGSTTFNVPDMRGYLPRGWADNGTIDAGRAFASTQTDAIKTHTVTITDPGHTHGLNNSASVRSNGSGQGYTSGSDAGAVATSIATATTGISAAYSGASETRPYNLALVFCIKN